MAEKADECIIRKATPGAVRNGTWWVTNGRLIVSCPLCGRTQGYVMDLGELTGARVELWCAHGKTFGPDFCDGYLCTLGPETEPEETP